MSPATDRSNPRHAVGLMYHDAHLNGDTDASGFKGTGPDWYKLDVADMNTQFASLAERYGARIASGTSVDDVPNKPLYITFDDGGASAATHIVDLLEANNMLGFFFITTNRIGTEGFVTEEQLREMRSRGHIIGSHSCSHPDNMWQLNAAQLRQEWCDSKARLEEILGETVDTASVPGGEYSSLIADMAEQAGYRYLFNSEPVKRTTRRGNCLVLGRYPITCNMSVDDVVKLGSATATQHQVKSYASSAVRKVLKRVAGNGYYRMRRMILERIRSH